MKTLMLAAIRCSLMFTAVTGSLVCVQSAQAYAVTLKEVEANVVANGSGAINLTGLIFAGSEGVSEEVGIRANIGIVRIGCCSGFVIEDQYVLFTGPTSFGSGGFFFANSGSGDLVGISGSANILV